VTEAVRDRKTVGDRKTEIDLLCDHLAHGTLELRQSVLDSS